MQIILKLMATAVAGLAFSYAAFADQRTNTGVTTGTLSGLRSPEQPVFVTLAVGPGFATGLKTNSALYNLLGSVNYNYTENFSGKLFGDLYFGDSTSTARFLNFGGGADFYLYPYQTNRAAPYLSGDAGFAMSRTSDDRNRNGFTVGAGLGFRFASSKANWDVNLHYSVLTAVNAGSNPTILALRGGMNF